MCTTLARGYCVMSNAWLNHSMHYQCLRFFSQRKVDHGWLVNNLLANLWLRFCLVDFNLKATTAFTANHLFELPINDNDDDND